MSYNILVEISDQAGNSQYSKGHEKRDFTPGRFCLNILALISRSLYFRKLKLAKFYMAAIVIIFMLFILLRSSPNSQAEPPQLNNNHAIESKDADDLQANQADLKQKAILQPPDLLQSAGDAQASSQLSQYDVRLISPNTHSKNITYALSMKDFIQVGNPNVMQTRVREAMQHSWYNYKRYAWGYDMLKPRSKEPDHWFHLGLTIVDSADTLLMMGMVDEANLALDWIENELNFRTSNENSNCFELTIRILAGILSAYHLTGREGIRKRAIEMGDVLLHCYDTESRVVPYSDIDLNTHQAHSPSWNPHSSLSEISSLQLEFRYLSQISGNLTYEETTFRTSTHLHELVKNRVHKLLPMYISPKNGQLEDSLITLGARTDSYYEYLLKQYLQTGIKWLEDDYLDAIDEIGTRLLRHTNGTRNYTYVAELQIYKTVNDTEDLRYHNKMDHLVCFLPGTLALGYYHFSPLAADYRLKYALETPKFKLNSRYDNHIDMAKALVRTCYHMYSDMGTGLSPEIAIFVHNEQDSPMLENQQELRAQSSATHNILRPEFVESLFYLYHITGLPKYRTQATQVFQSFEKYSRIQTGYSPVSDVRQKPPADADLDLLLHNHAPDRMESFWLSETLKYFYLIFCDDKRMIGTILNKYVFNTEAHLLPIL